MAKNHAPSPRQQQVQLQFVVRERMPHRLIRHQIARNKRDHSYIILELIAIVIEQHDVHGLVQLCALKRQVKIDALWEHGFKRHGREEITLAFDLDIRKKSGAPSSPFGSPVSSS